MASFIGCCLCGCCDLICGIGCCICFLLILIILHAVLAVVNGLLLDEVFQVVIGILCFDILYGLFVCFLSQDLCVC